MIGVLAVELLWWFSPNIAHSRAHHSQTPHSPRTPRPLPGAFDSPPRLCRAWSMHACPRRAPRRNVSALASSVHFVGQGHTGALAWLCGATSGCRPARMSCGLIAFPAGRYLLGGCARANVRNPPPGRFALGRPAGPLRAPEASKHGRSMLPRLGRCRFATFCRAAAAAARAHILRDPACTSGPRRGARVPSHDVRRD